MCVEFRPQDRLLRREMRREHGERITPTIAKLRIECTESLRNPGELELPKSVRVKNRTYSMQSLFLQISPTQAKHVRATVKLTLDRINRTALIEPKHFVVQIEERRNKFQSGVQAVAAL
jgi:hypothetical protein